MSDRLMDATARLERALAQLETRTRALATSGAGGAGDTDDDDLFAGKVGAHDNELRAAAQQASEALARAAEALSAAIGEED